MIKLDSLISANIISASQVFSLILTTYVPTTTLGIIPSTNILSVIFKINLLLPHIQRASQSINNNNNNNNNNNDDKLDCQNSNVIKLQPTIKKFLSKIQKLIFCSTHFNAAKRCSYLIDDLLQSCVSVSVAKQGKSVSKSSFVVGRSLVLSVQVCDGIKMVLTKSLNKWAVRMFHCVQAVANCSDKDRYEENGFNLCPETPYMMVLSNACLRLAWCSLIVSDSLCAGSLLECCTKRQYEVHPLKCCGGCCNLIRLW